MRLDTKENSDWRAGQTVQVIAGPFGGFVGTIYEIYADRNRVRIVVDYRGRETPVELGYHQIVPRRPDPGVPRVEHL